MRIWFGCTHANTFHNHVTLDERASGVCRLSSNDWEGMMRPIVAVRPASTDERASLEAIQRRASLRNPGDRAALLANPDCIELPIEQIETGGVFVAEVAGAVQGFAAILPRDDGDAELDALFVEPEAWQQGIGRALVEACCVAARAAGARCLYVVGNPHAEGFYTSCGFKMLGTMQMRFGVGLLMKRDLG